MLTIPRTFFTLVSLVAALLTTQAAHATEVGAQRTFGLGVALGDPTSFVGKVFIGPENAIDFGVGFLRLWNRCRTDNGTRVCGSAFGSFTVHGDYLWQFDIVKGAKAKLDWHIGAGGRVWLNENIYGSDLAIAGRMPVGVDLTFRKPSFIELYLEVAPAMYVFPEPDLRPEGNLGIRFYF